MNAIVCLSASNIWYGRVIRNLTHSNVNHAFIAYHSPLNGGWQVVQADRRGVVEVPAESIHPSYLECYRFPNLDLLTALPRVRDLIGDAYDWEGIGGFLLKLAAWKIARRRIVNPLHKAGELFCSEFCGTYLQRVDGMYDWMMEVRPSGLAPGGTIEYLGVPSLQELLQTHAVIRVSCPWK